jgi:hypothetical protein
VHAGPKRIVVVEDAGDSGAGRAGQLAESEERLELARRIDRWVGPAPLTGDRNRLLERPPDQIEVDVGQDASSTASGSALTTATASAVPHHRHRTSSTSSASTSSSSIVNSPPTV